MFGFMADIKYYNSNTKTSLLNGVPLCLLGTVCLTVECRAGCRAEQEEWGVSVFWLVVVWLSEAWRFWYPEE